MLCSYFCKFCPLQLESGRMNAKEVQKSSWNEADTLTLGKVLLLCSCFETFVKLGISLDCSLKIVSTQLAQ